MPAHSLQQGQSLIEIIFAISIFVIGVVTIGYLTIDAFTSMQRVTDSTQARLLAVEGIEALVSISDAEFDITAGTYGLALEGGIWTLIKTPDEQGKFTRTITIHSIDDDTFEVASQVAWTIFGGRERSVLYESLLSNWRQTKGEAGELAVSTDNVSLISFDTEVIGLFVENEGEAAITITDMSFAWGMGALLTGVSIEDTVVFSASTSAPAASEAELDIVDYTIEAGSGFHHVNSLLFDGSVAGSNLVVSFTFEDGSVRSVYVTP